MTDDNWYPPDGVFEVYGIDSKTKEVNVFGSFKVTDGNYFILDPKSSDAFLWNYGDYLFRSRDLDGCRFHANNCHRIKKRLFFDRDDLERALVEGIGEPKTNIAILKVK